MVQFKTSKIIIRRLPMITCLPQTKTKTIMYIMYFRGKECGINTTDRGVFSFIYLLNSIFLLTVCFFNVALPEHIAVV